MSTVPTLIPPLDDQLAAIKKVFGIGVVVVIVLGALLLACLVSTVQLAAKIGEVAKTRSVYVIPGAAEGVYAPGLTEYNVRNAARYLLGLGANLTPANAEERLAELEKYCMSDYVPAFQAEKIRSLKEIQSQTQSRALQPDRGDSLTVDEKKIYTYAASGTWEIKSGSLLMSALRHRFTLRFFVGNADRGNPYGIQLLSFDVAPLDDPGRRDAAHAATLPAHQNQSP